MKLLVDENLSIRVAGMLRDAVHGTAVGLRSTNDEVILQAAANDGSSGVSGDLVRMRVRGVGVLTEAWFSASNSYSPVHAGVGSLRVNAPIPASASRAIMLSAITRPVWA
jgi:hypothetical protein